MFFFVFIADMTLALDISQRKWRQCFILFLFLYFRYFSRDNPFHIFYKCVEIPVFEKKSFYPRPTQQQTGFRISLPIFYLFIRAQLTCSFFVFFFLYIFLLYFRISPTS